MSHRDNTIKKNKEFKKPMDLMNVGFVGNVGSVGGVPNIAIFAGGRAQSITYFDDVEKVDFSNNTAGGTFGNLGVGRNAHGGISSSDGFGVFCGGTISGADYSNNCEKIDFTTETANGTFGNLAISW